MSTNHVRLIKFYVKVQVYMFYLLMYFICTTPVINIDLFGPLTEVQL